MSVAVYVAGSSAELDRARHVMAALRLHGITVTSTWLEAIEAAGTANEGLTRGQRIGAATTCEREVESSDVLLLLVPSEPSGIGCGWEAGYARALGLHLVAAGRTERTVFAATVEEHRSDLDAIAAVLRMAGER
jgi:nucleoside 2-deoxyribosyltransferase